MWEAFCSELQRRWDSGAALPRLPKDDTPDLRFCLLHQKLQMLQRCMAVRVRAVARSSDS
jgi:Rab3 GTPase-activating protein catalytic subunit